MPSIFLASFSASISAMKRLKMRSLVRFSTFRAPTSPVLLRGFTPQT